MAVPIVVATASDRGPELVATGVIRLDGLEPVAVSVLWFVDPFPRTTVGIVEWPY